jgi:hypothetical protein
VALLSLVELVEAGELRAHVVERTCPLEVSPTGVTV